MVEQRLPLCRSVAQRNEDAYTKSILVGEPRAGESRRDPVQLSEPNPKAAVGEQVEPAPETHCQAVEAEARSAQTLTSDQRVPKTDPS